jgi:peptidoglycan/LPS O-acetylase OafA/YrhL
MTTNKRNYTVDLLRLLAAYGVVSIHVPYSTPAAGNFGDFLSPLCVPFFFITSLFYFIANLQKSVSVQDVFYKMYIRILLPYLCWTVIYVLLILIKAHFVGNHHSFVIWRIVFYGESSVQLFFLPELLAMQCFAFAIYLFFSGDKKKILIGVLTFAVALIYLVLGTVNKAFGITPIPALVLYLLVPYLLYKKVNGTPPKMLFIILGIVLLIITELLEFNTVKGTFMGSLTRLPIGGIGLLLLALGTPIISIRKWLINLCVLSYGIYLCHIVFLEGFEIGLKKVLHKQIIYDLPVKLIVVTIIFICSIVLVWLLKKVKFTKRLFLGE